MNVLPQLDRMYRSIEERKVVMLALLEAMTDEERSKNPTPAEWSALQVMEHIVSVEELPSKAALPMNAKVMLKGYAFSSLGGGFMRFSARTGMRVPTLPVFEPSGELNFTDIKMRWAAARHALGSQLEAVSQTTRPFMLHPIAGPLNAGQFLALLDVHLAYHWRHFPRAKP